MNFHYDYWVNQLLEGNTSWVGSTYTAYLVTSGYVPSKTAATTTADIPASAIIATAMVENRTTDGRFMLADDLRFDAATDTTSAAAVVLADANGVLSHYISSIAGIGVSSDNTAVELLWADCGISSL